MALGVGGAIAEGLESGWRMSREMDADVEAKRARKVQEDRQAAADTRAQQEFDLRKAADKRAADQTLYQNQRQDRLDQQTASDKAYQRLVGEREELVKSSKAIQEAGGKVTPEMAAQFGQNEQSLAVARQEARNFFSRAQSGLVDPMSKDVSPGDLYFNMTAATGMAPEELQQMPKHIADIQSGMQTNNQGLTIQGVNGLMAPRLRMGVGTPSAHGGIIESKEIVGLVPAQDANGQVHPDKVFPVIRVNVTGGDVPSYIAPMTHDGTVNGNIPPIDLKRAMDYMGNVGLLANATKNPQIADKLAQGKAEAGDRAQQYLDQLNALGKPKKQLKHELVDLGGYVLDRERDDEGNVVSEKRIDKTAVPRMFSPSEMAGAGGGAGGGAAGGGGVGGKGTGATGATGEEYLSTLGNADARIVRAIAEGRMDIKDVSTAKGRRERVMAMVDQYSSNANTRGFRTGQQTENAFARGVEGRAVRSFNVAIDHLDTLQEVGNALKNNNAQVFNKLSNYIATQTGSEAPTNFEGVKRIVADEVVKAVVGANGALGDREEAAKAINAASSPAQLNGLIKRYQQLMGGQLKGLAGQYYGGGGLKDFGETFLSDRSRKLLGDSVPKNPARSSTGEGSASSGPRKISNEADYNALPSGAVFIGPDGRQRRKP